MVLYIDKILILLSLFFVTATSYRILVIFPTGSISHQIPQLAVSEALAEKGHHVTIIAPNTFDNPHPNITQVNINFTYNYVKMFDFTESIDGITLLQLCKVFWARNSDGILSYPPVKSIFKKENNEKFDAVIMEVQPYNPLFMAKHVFDATLIGLLTIHLYPPMHSALGNVNHPVLHPGFFSNVPPNPTFFDRIQAVYVDIYQRYWVHNELYPVLDQIIKKHFPDSKTNSEQLFRDVDFVIEGLTPVFGNVRPLVPNTIQIGYLHIKEPKPLPTSLQKYLDNSKNGVIYLSFGSNVKSALIKPEIRRVLMETIRDMKYDVLWKFENETFPGKPNNVRIEKWLPQTDLLAHKNIKLFITQGGQQSMDETIARGVPVIVIPFFADQESNAGKMQEIGIGFKLTLQELSVQSLTQKIHEVIDNPIYKQNAKVLGDRVRDTMMPARDMVVWWIEYAIRNRGAPHLKYKGTKVSFIEYYLIDIIVFHVFMLVLLMIIIIKIVRKFTSKLEKNDAIKKKVS